MSRQHINAYRRTLAEQHRVTGSLNEGVVSKAFADLLERTGRSNDLIFSPQWEGKGPRGNSIRVDGALRSEARPPEYLLCTGYPDYDLLPRCIPDSVPASR